MDLEDKSEILRLKKELDERRKGISKWNSLMQKREELEKQINERREKQERIQDDRTVLNEELLFLKKRLRELDHLLDHLEEFSSHKMDDIENQLVEAILKTDPELKAGYHVLESSLNQAKLQIQNLYFMQQGLTNIQLLLQTVLQTRQRVKRKNILSYIFGYNPNLIISQHLQAIADQLDLLLPFFKENWEDQVFFHFLQKLQTECKERWGFRKIDNFFQDVSKTLENALKSLNDQIVSYENNYQSLVEKKEEWLQLKGLKK